MKQGQECLLSHPKSQAGRGKASGLRPGETHCGLLGLSAACLGPGEGCPVQGGAVRPTHCEEGHTG